VRERSRMVRFAQAIRSGELIGLTGKRFTDIVTIGIGGSHLGPAMAIRALAPYHDGPAVHFVSNVDAAAITDTLAPLDPGATLFVIASKTFTTVETMTNAATARQWVINRLGEAAMRHHFAALSSAPDKVVDFGIADDRTFGFWEWVGGRFSLWSSIGLPIVIALGEHNVAALLAGARQMDHHFLECPMERNIPIVQA
jgi:glucose-6-phosphate isomerase